MVILNFILLFLQAKSYNIISLQPFEQYSFSEGDNNIVIFKFESYDNSSNSPIIFSRQDFNQESMEVYFYLEDSIIQFENQTFINFDDKKEFQQNTYQEDLIFEYENGNTFYFACKFYQNPKINFTIMIYTDQDILIISQRQLNYEKEQCYYFKRSLNDFQFNINDISKYSYLHVQSYQLNNYSNLYIIGGRQFEKRKQLNEYIDINGHDKIMLKYSIYQPIINRICFEFLETKIIDIENNKILNLYSDGNYSLYYRKNFNFEITENFEIELNNCFEPKFYCKNINKNYLYQIEKENEGDFKNCIIIKQNNLKSNFVIQNQNLFSDISTFMIKIKCKLLNKNLNQLDYISLKINKVTLFQNYYFKIKPFLNVFVFFFIFSIIITIVFKLCCKHIDSNERYNNFERIKSNNLRFRKIEQS